MTFVEGIGRNSRLNLERWALLYFTFIVVDFMYIHRFYPPDILDIVPRIDSSTISCAASWSFAVPFPSQMYKYASQYFETIWSISISLHCSFQGSRKQMLCSNLKATDEAIIVDRVVTKWEHSIACDISDGMSSCQQGLFYGCEHETCTQAVSTDDHCHWVCLKQVMLTRPTYCL